MPWPAVTWLARLAMLTLTGWNPLPLELARRTWTPLTRPYAPAARPAPPFPGALRRQHLHLPQVRLQAQIRRQTRGQQPALGPVEVLQAAGQAREEPRTRPHPHRQYPRPPTAGY